MKIELGKQSMIIPMPVLMIATYNEDGSVNVMNAAWGGIHDTNQIGICIDRSHKTFGNILRTKALTVSFADKAHLVPCDYLGIVSGNKEPGKFEKTGLTAVKSAFVDAPVINELSVVLECKLASYTEDSDYIVADILNLSADDSILTDGRIDLKKVDPIVYDGASHSYFSLGEAAGPAFSAGKMLM